MEKGKCILETWYTCLNADYQDLLNSYYFALDRKERKENSKDNVANVYVTTRGYTSITAVDSGFT